MSHCTLNLRWAKPELALCVAGILLFVVLKYLILESPARHRRLWQEAQLLGELGQRQGLYSESDALLEIALIEAGRLGSDDPRTAITLSDRGFLHFRQGNFHGAASDFAMAAQRLSTRPKTVNADVNSVLVAESLRIELQRARSLQASGQLEGARNAYLEVIKIYGRSDHSNFDRAADFRLKQAFLGFCTAVDGASSEKEWESLFTALSKVVPFARFTSDQKHQMLFALRNATSSMVPNETRRQIIGKFIVLLGH